MESESEMHKRVIEESLWVINDVNTNIYWRAVKNIEKANQILRNSGYPNLRFIEHIYPSSEILKQNSGRTMGYIYDINGGFNSIHLYYRSETKYDSPHKKKHFKLLDRENAEYYKDIYISVSLEDAINKIRELFYNKGYKENDLHRYRLANHNCERIQFLENDGSFNRNKPIQDLFNSENIIESKYKFKFNKKYIYSKESNTDIVGHITLKNKHIVQFNRTFNPDLEVSYLIVDNNYKVNATLRNLINDLCKILSFRF